MSAIIETFLTCDGCGENYGVDNRSFTASQQRWSARSSGWVYSGGKDYCPNCKKRKIKIPETIKEQEDKRSVANTPNQGTGSL